MKEPKQGPLWPWGTVGLSYISLNITDLRKARRKLAGKPGPTVVRACLWPKPQQLPNCTLQAFATRKAGIAFQTRIELACSNKDVACLFQAFGLVHKRTLLMRRETLQSTTPRGRTWPSALSCLEQTRQAADCKNWPTNPNSRFST